MRSTIATCACTINEVELIYLDLDPNQGVYKWEEQKAVLPYASNSYTMSHVHCVSHIKCTFAPVPLRQIKSLRNIWVRAACIIVMSRLQPTFINHVFLKYSEFILAAFIDLLILFCSHRQQRYCSGRRLNSALFCVLFSGGLLR